MAKKWWFPLDFRVWRTDSRLRRCSLETRGFWLECLCAMHEEGAFEITGTLEEVGWLIGCAPEIVARCAVELQRTKAADVTLGNGSVTLLSRRLQRDLNGREQTRLRVRKHRSNADVTIHNNSNSNNNNKNKREEAEIALQATPLSLSPKPSRGTRLPDDFSITPEMSDYAKLKRPEIDHILETEKFCNYWLAKSGKDATKIDWQRTWKNWILNAKAVNGNGNGKSHRPPDTVGKPPADLAPVKIAYNCSECRDMGIIDRYPDEPEIFHADRLQPCGHCQR